MFDFIVWLLGRNYKRICFPLVPDYQYLYTTFVDTLPTGTVTFLFTDIEGSTKLAQEHPDKWEKTRARHHAILQSAMDAHNGYVFQIIGDAFCVAFHTANDGLRAAIEAQQKLQKEDWGETPIKVRMGLHTGEAETDGRDYHGYLTMAKVQRVMSVAYGGQVLLSNASAELVYHKLPSGINLRDMKEHRLKGMPDPEQLWQVVAPDLQQDYPPLQSLVEIPNNLPAQLSTFIGREKEIAEVETALCEHRLVTLTGSGGAGKTRLSLQIAANLLDSFPNGIWFVELATITDPDLIPQTILSAAEMRAQQGRTALDSLKDFLREKTSLLILDNCEHLIEVCAKLTETLLSVAPNLKVLASSREALGVNGEKAWHVPSLSIPDLKHLPAVEQLSQYEAVRLFIDRASLLQPHFAVTNDNALAVAQICSRLDGIPLAIELAAARVKVLKAEQIAERLNDRFRLLTGGSRTALPRQQTLRALIDWSYELLSENERTLLRKLAVFSGGCTLEAAERVCNDDNIQVDDVLDLLTHLVDKSLIILQDGRYRMLETTRQYAREKMIGAGEEMVAQQAHFDYFILLAEEAEIHLLGPDQVIWLNRIEKEHDNCRTALEWYMQNQKGDRALRMAGALGIFWCKHSHFSEGRRWLGKLLMKFSDAPEQVQVKAWRFAGVLAIWQQDGAEAYRIFTENMEREQKLGDQWGIAYSLVQLANVALSDGEVEQAMALNKRSITLSREIDAFWVLAMAHISLGYVEHALGNLSRAEELYTESLRHCRRLGEKWGSSLALENLGSLMCWKKDFVAAKKFFLECLEISWELGEKDTIRYILAGLATVYQNEGRHKLSAQLQGIVIAMEREYGLMSHPVEKELFDTTADCLKTSMGEQAYQHELEIGKSLTLEETVARVLKESQ